jgi:pyrroloquinoline quinone biosynthesis protein B
MLISLLFAGCAVTQGQSGVKPAGGESRYQLWVLGRAQDGGLPHVGCEQVCCETARQTGRVETPACLGIHDAKTDRLLLIEATPAIESQLSFLHELSGSTRPSRVPVDGILLTHAHIGHYTGLMQLGREVASTKKMPVWVTPRMAEFLRHNGPWSQLVQLEQIKLLEVSPGSSFSPLEGLEIEAITVPHRDEFSDTVAFRIHGPHRTVLFVPDVDRWSGHDGLLESLLEGVDIAYIDATFYDGRELPGRDLSEIPHPPMVDTMRRLADQAKQHPGSFRFIHLNHTNPAMRDTALQRSIKDAGFAVAVPGERVGL